MNQVSIQKGQSKATRQSESTTANFMIQKYTHSLNHLIKQTIHTLFFQSSSPSKKGPQGPLDQSDE
jgi:hypothetical protein